MRGHECFASYSTRPVDIARARPMRLNITDRQAVSAAVAEIKPDAVIHCAAWTNVDAAQDPENIQTVRAVNVRGTENAALACREAGCPMVYISTDYVFDGGGTKPRSADQENYSPLNVYGRSKLDGEYRVRELLERYYIVRTQWVFGSRGDSFVSAMLRAGRTHSEIRVVDDQFGVPTYTRHLARLLVDMCETDRYGCYHATNSGGFISRCDLAKEIFRQAGYDVNVLPVSTEGYGPQKAERPLNGRLDCSKLTRAGFDPLPDWKSAVSEYLFEIEGGK